MSSTRRAMVRAYRAGLDDRHCVVDIEVRGGDRERIITANRELLSDRKRLRKIKNNRAELYRIKEMYGM